MNKEDWIKELKNLKLSGLYIEGTKIPVEIVDFIEKLLYQQRKKLINKIKQTIANLEHLKTKKLFVFLEELKDEKNKKVTKNN